MTHYIWGYSDVFKASLAHFNTDEKAKVKDFIVTYQDHGLADFTKYPGKITRTGSGNCTEEEKNFAQTYHLWHYHIGLPTYVQSSKGNYKTSRDVLHFQWFQKENRIVLVDMYRHYLLSGKFYVPDIKSLEVPPELKSKGPEANDDTGDFPEAV